jgi:hypothetical protein
MSEDRYGLPLSSRPSRAVEAYVAAVDAILSGNVGADEAVDRALSADPDFALAHAAGPAPCRCARAPGRRPRGPNNELARAATPRERGRVKAVSLALGHDVPRPRRPAGTCASSLATPSSSLATGVYSLTGQRPPDRNELPVGILDELAPPMARTGGFSMSTPSPARKPAIPRAAGGSSSAR